MASSILFFGDGSVSLHPAYAQVLHSRRPGSLLSTFLDRSRAALQDEIRAMPAAHRALIARINLLEDLIPRAGSKTPDDQCFAPAMLAIIQLGQFIRYLCIPPGIIPVY